MIALPIMSGRGTASWSLYPYDPVKPLPMLFAALIFILAVVHVYQSFIRYHWKYFGSTMLWASSVWIAGFICRAYSIYHPQSIGTFIAQYVLIILGPPLYSASEYFILGRLMEYLPYHAPMHPGRVLSTFVILSAAVESLTASGAASSAGNDSTLRKRATGLNLVKAALILQAVVEIGFFSLVATLEVRCRRTGRLPRHVRIVCAVLYVTSLMMLLRCIVRAVEGFEQGACDPTSPSYTGYCGVVPTHEWFLWVFEVANITLFVAALAFFPPGRYLPRDKKVYLDPVDGRTERVGPGFAKADKRPLLTTVLDPFDLNGIFTGKGRSVQPFWEEEHPVLSAGGPDRRTVKQIQSEAKQEQSEA